MWGAISGPLVFENSRIEWRPVSWPTAPCMLSSSLSAQRARLRWKRSGICRKHSKTAVILVGSLPPICPEYITEGHKAHAGEPWGVVGKLEAGTSMIVARGPFPRPLIKSKK